MTPVGGALICSPAKKKDSLAVKVAGNYPGRASMSPKLDLFMTLLEMGKSGYRQLLESQKQHYDLVLAKLQELDMTEVICSNGISIAISLEKVKQGDLKSIGSMLFTRNVSGPRVVTCQGSGLEFYVLILSLFSRVIYDSIQLIESFFTV